MRITLALLGLFLMACFIPLSCAQIFDYHFDRSTFYSSSDSGTLTLTVQNNMTTQITITRAQIAFVFYADDGAPSDYTYAATGLPITLQPGDVVSIRIDFQVKSSIFDIYAAPADIFVVYTVSGLADTYSRIISTTIPVKGETLMSSEEQEAPDQTTLLLEEINDLRRQVSTLEQQLSESQARVMALSHDLTDLQTRLDTMTALAYIIGAITGFFAVLLVVQRRKS